MNYYTLQRILIIGAGCMSNNPENRYSLIKLFIEKMDAQKTPKFTQSIRWDPKHRELIIIEDPVEV